jgi:glycosyltransferase involved in cell wall biosynthesis
MSILDLCSPHYGYGMNSTQGGAVYERELLTRIGRYGIHVDVVMNPNGEWVDAENVTVRTLRMQRLFRLSSTAAFYKGILDSWRLKRFDALRAHSFRAPLFASVLFCKTMADVPFFVHIHHLEEGDERFYGVNVGGFLRSSAGVLTVSEFSAQQIVRQFRLSQDRVFVAYDGIDTAKYAPREVQGETLRWKKGEKRLILFVGGLLPRKNLFFLCDVAQELERRKNNVLLAIVGTGPLEETLRNYIRDKELSNVVMLLGKIPENEKLDLYNLCDVFVFPSLFEGFGMAPAEAMACEKPVVVSNVTSLPELVCDGQTGFICDPRRKDDFVEKIQYLLNHDDVRKTIGRLARQSVTQRFDWERTAARVAGIYVNQRN